MIELDAANEARAAFDAHEGPQVPPPPPPSGERARWVDHAELTKEQVVRSVTGKDGAISLLGWRLREAQRKGETDKARILQQVIAMGGVF